MVEHRLEFRRQARRLEIVTERARHTCRAIARGRAVAEQFEWPIQVRLAHPTGVAAILATSFSPRPLARPALSTRP
jgi:hypothetical protein